MCETETSSAAETVWYLAIGSMLLPLSYELRDFHPIASQPAELLDYRLGFFGPSGFAEAIPAPGESLHGVLHKVTPAQLLELDKLEVGYVRTTGQARPYGDGEEKEIVTVTVYCRPKREMVNNPPMERYLEIIIAGAKHFGVDPEYVRFLQEHAFQPRSLPQDFKSFADAPSDRHYTQVPETKEGGNAYFSLNGKILEVSYPPDHPIGNFLSNLWKSKGPHFEVGFSQMQLDLKYGIVRDIEGCTPEHSAYLEDGFYRFLDGRDELKYFSVIGSFRST